MVGTLFIAVGTFIVVLGLLVFLRSRDNRYEIKVTDIVVAVLPVFIYLLVSGKIESLEFGESGIKVVAAINKASGTEIKSQVTPIEAGLVRTVESGAKEGTAQIPKLITKKTEALTFTLGYKGYTKEAINEYLEQLTRKGALKYVILQNEDGSFFGSMDARRLYVTFTSGNPSMNVDRFRTFVVDQNREALKNFPGFIAADQAMHVNDDKRRALKEMEDLNVESLPVVDKDNRYIGIVDRSRLTASLILDVAQAVAK